MKNKIYAISLLLSFLAVLSHEMIAHHHHDELALNFSISYEQDGHKSKFQHNKKNQHNHNSQQEEKSSEHIRPFPFHLHISATNDINIEGTNLLESNSQIRDIALLVFTKLFRSEIFKPPDLELKLYEEPAFLISSLCNLEAIALRGPPVIV